MDILRLPRLAVDHCIYFSLKPFSLVYKPKYTFLPFESFFDQDASVGSLGGKRRRLGMLSVISL